MDSDLICNVKKCRKRLTALAWVTSCSHIFCDDDGAKHFNKSFTCPACETRLAGKFDIVRIDLQPTDRYKSMVLAGQKPEVIIEICSRAMDFWCYQAHQERMFQEYQASKAKEKCSQMEQYYEQLLSRTQTELASLKSQLTAGKKDLAETKKKLHEASEKIVDRNRQYQKLQAMYDSLRRKCITPASFEGSGDAPIRSTPSRSFEIPIATGEDFLRRPGSTLADFHIPVTSRRPTSPAEREFTLNPMSTPITGASGGDEVTQMSQRFIMDLGTPSHARAQRDNRR